MRYILLLLLLFNAAYAAGPEKIATYDRSLWPEALDSGMAFDRASRFAIYQFLTTMDKVDFSEKNAVAVFTGIKAPDMPSVQKFRKLTEARLLDNYKASCASLSEHEKKVCQGVDNIRGIIDTMTAEYNGLGKQYEQWKEKSQQFHRRYVYEQFRLAALFPRITSEILKLEENEYDGFELKDKQFLLTFDDGPSANDGTDKLIKKLNTLHMNGIFFVLGEKLETYNAEGAKRLYDGQCVSSHGYDHKPHPKYDQWQASLDKTERLIADTLSERPENILFRPPYGQRNTIIVDYLKHTYGSRVMLWNIDSQDWMKKISAKDAADRVLTLMLLWRRGILLFHDIHPKAIEALDPLHENAEATTIKFLDCHSITNSRHH